MQNVDHPLGNISLSKFLQEFWQQKPLLIRNAIPNYSCPISANEMAGLACEADIESRIITEQRAEQRAEQTDEQTDERQGEGDKSWQCQHGPFEESLFSQLPETHWTLLLQSCNIYIPAFAQLLERFRFIPNWRVDDIMVSYAPLGGSVGPHTDNYDVFLLQAEGKRRWQISTQAFSEADFYPDMDLKILKSFTATQTWELDPGDMLYLPPGVAHHGVAMNDCITVSIGFRAPNSTQLSTAFLDQLLSEQDSKHSVNFYQDPNIPIQENSGEITSWALQRIKNMLNQELNAKLLNDDWFGIFITDTPLTAEMRQPPITPQQCLLMLTAGQQPVRNEASKLAFTRSEKNNIHFFCNGAVTHYPMQLLPIISLVCNNRNPPLDLLLDCLNNAEAQSFLCHILNQGHLFFEQDFDDDD